MYNFIHVPKVAGDAFNRIISERRGQIVYAGHIQASTIKTLAFVRNPYDRLVSAYFYLMSGGGRNRLDISYYKILRNYKDFEDFVLNINLDGLHEKIIHIRPMYWFLCDENNKVIVDTIYKIEDISEIDKFTKSLGIREKLSERIHNSSSHLPYTEYLNSDVIKEINKIYNLDFELFNYEKL